MLTIAYNMNVLMLYDRGQFFVVANGQMFDTEYNLLLFLPLIS
jgi:hypothetical protein